MHTLLDISHKLTSNAGKGVCVSVCFKSIQPLPDVNTHQRLQFSFLFPVLSVPLWDEVQFPFSQQSITVYSSDG